MHFSRRSGLFTLVALATLGVAALPGRPACAQGTGQFTIGNVVSPSSNGTGSFDVLLTSQGGDLSVGGFSSDLTLTASGVTFTGADFGTGTAYIFPNSLDQDYGLTLTDETDDPFPNASLIASDSDDSQSSVFTVTDGTTVGLAHITFHTDTPNVPFTVSFADFGVGTSLTDGGGGALAFNTTNGTITPAPEPSTWAAFTFTGLGVAGLMLRAKQGEKLSGDSSN